MASMDIFDGDAFSTIELTNALKKVPHKPSFLRSLGIFTPRSIRTLFAAYEKVGQVLSLVQTSERGEPLDQRDNEKRDIRAFRTHRLARGNKLRADEIQSIRAFGSETELMQVQAEAMDRMIKVRDDIELTFEYHALGAIQGIVLDADGTSTLNNWYTAWGITQPAEIDLDLDNANPAEGALKKKCNDIIRTMMRSSNGAWTPATRVLALCGDNAYDDLTTGKETRDTYKNQTAANELRGDYANVFDSFRYGNIEWVNYRGTDDNSTVAIGTDKVKFLPVGARDVFEHVSSPGESFDWVNTPGQEIYSLLVRDLQRNQWVIPEVYSYPLFSCTRPEMLLRGKRT